MSENILADRYRLDQKIGEGGMAVVYLAMDLRTGHNVAIKVLKPEYSQDQELVSRFQREAEAASKMTHHNIVNLLDVGMAGQYRYLVMEYVHGKTLKQVIQEKGRLSANSAAQITIRILSALQHAHANGIIHRDIKPQNILVHEDGHIKVADFGIARMTGSSTLTRDDTVMGTVHYFSPEQASGKEVRETSDIYSVGVVLYEMLTGRVPFDGENYVAIAMKHLHTRPTPINTIAPDVPEAVCRVCMRAMEKNPIYRYQSAADMATDLRLALEGRQIQPMPQIVDTGRHGPSVTNTNQQQIVPQTVQQPYMGKQKKSKSQMTTFLLVSIMALAVFVGLYFGGKQIYSQIVDKVTVPYVIGYEATEAERTAARNGLTVEVVQVEDMSSAGTVIMQTPAADSRIKKGDTLVLTVSLGPGTRYVPKLIGSLTTEAQSLLQTPELTLTVVERTVSTEPEGTILTQTPEAGTECHPGDVVQVSVSGGAANVPNLSGKTLEDARLILYEAGLNMNGTVQYISTNIASQHGQIAEQQPSAGSQVILGSTVSVSIWRDPAQTHAAFISLDLSNWTTDITLKVTINEGDEERTVWEGGWTADSPRRPSLELNASSAGEHTYRVYVDGKFVFQDKVQMD